MDVALAERRAPIGFVAKSNEIFVAFGNDLRGGYWTVSAVHFGDNRSPRSAWAT